jgi:hypothetical protein
LAIDRSMTWHTWSGTPRERRSGGGSVRMRRSIGTIDSSVGEENAGDPCRSSKMVDPREYTSAATVGRWPSSTSGGAWAMLAVITPLWVS